MYHNPIPLVDFFLNPLRVTPALRVQLMIKQHTTDICKANEKCFGDCEVEEFSRAASTLKPFPYRHEKKLQIVYILKSWPHNFP